MNGWHFDFCACDTFAPAHCMPLFDSEKSGEIDYVRAWPTAKVPPSLSPSVSVCVCVRVCVFLLNVSASISRNGQQ